jgi:Alw26I/Eco31I/Esp3I family type II restriction m6 adenine DNA methyltransferase
MTYCKDNLRQIFQQPFNEEGWQNMLRQYFHATELKAERERINDTPDDEKGYYLGALDTSDSYRIGLFYYQIQRGNVARKRVGLRNLVKSFINPNWGEFDAALAVFDSGSVWRLSFVCDIKGENTAAKRFTYVFGESDNYYNTPVGRFDALQRNSISFENIKDAFSVERLNKDFFNGYKERYVKFLNHINEDTKENRDYVKKLLGRLVFLQFLQKKGWMGVPANQQGWIGGDKFYLNHLIENYEGNDRLLSDVLEPLFFNTLNERRINDLADSRLGENIKIPYLNGGLFDKDNLDKKDIDFPYDYFKELMDFFAMYNFTIDENDPEDSEIGIDPEMLGHIFENLLEDNKDKGAFYTPKEIVQYMSQESVAQYLKSHAPEELHTAIDSLIKQRVVEPILQNKENARQVNKALSAVKVCDPAIGSGAFPMGVLNVLFDCRHLLYGFIGKNEDFSYAKVKRDIIQNNIYGVDIEKGAVDIARLRFWLALVVDENEPQPLPNLDYKIMCGDSLLHRFALDAPFQNVLKDYNQKNDTHYTLDDYRQWVYDYTDISDHTQKDDFRKRIEDIKRAVKTELNDKEKGKIAKVRGAIDNLQMEDMFGGKKNEKKIKVLQKELKALEQQRAEIESNKIYDQAFEWRFEFPALLDENGGFMGFDIVIGNPPYNELRDLDMSIQEALKTTQYYEHAKGGRLNMFQFFYPLAIDVIKEGGIISLITQNSILAESSTFGNRKLFLDRTDILSIDSFPERDNTKTRVFESVKMSVCICTLKRKDVPNKDLVIPITVWHSKYMNENHHIDIKKKELVDIYPDDYIFPISSNENFEVLKKLIAKKEYSIVASAGEIDMTKYRSYFNLTRNGSRVLTGAQVLRYSITDTPSQGEVYYLERKFQNFSAKRANEIQNPRIVLQRITGVDSEIRIIATYSENCYLCANSTNYIVPDRNVDSLYLLGVINSKLINFFVKQTSTNTNITSKVIASFPVIISNKKVEATISRFVADILYAKQKGRDTSTLESRIDLFVYHLYGLTYDEVLIVDPETPITRDEYEQI